MFFLYALLVFIISFFFISKSFVIGLNESIKGKMTGYAQYEILIEFEGKKVILMKQAIAKVEVI